MKYREHYINNKRYIPPKYTGETETENRILNSNQSFANTNVGYCYTSDKEKLHIKLSEMIACMNEEETEHYFNEIFGGMNEI